MQIYKMMVEIGGIGKFIEWFCKNLQLLKIIPAIKNMGIYTGITIKCA